MNNNQHQSTTTINQPSASETALATSDLNSQQHRTKVYEFLPQTNEDPILLVLRDLFLRSFDTYYKEIEEQLELKNDKILIQWLDETYIEMQDEMLQKTIRCFLLCGEADKIIGFLTLKEEKTGSIYVAQCAIRADIKRKGYGTQLLRYLRTIYPPGTFYWGLCRRANRPAIQFYIQLGAHYIKDDEIANKYGYDPNLYTGFEFIDNTNSASPSKSSEAADERKDDRGLKWQRCIIL